MILFWRKRLKVVYTVLALLALSAGACRSESEIWRNGRSVKLLHPEGRLGPFPPGGFRRGRRRHDSAL